MPARESRPLAPGSQRRSYSSYATFSDPDGNAWVLRTSDVMAMRILERCAPVRTELMSRAVRN